VKLSIMHRIILFLALSFLEVLADLTGSASAQTTLDAVRERGYVRCGSFTRTPGLSFMDEKGAFSGFETDFCWALAAAVTGSKDRLEFVPLEISSRFDALRNGEIDVLFGRTTWNFARDVGLGITFAAVNYIEIQGVVAHRTPGLTTLEQIDKTRICVIAGTTSDTNLADYIEKSAKPWTVVRFESLSVMWDSFFSGHCDLVTGDWTPMAIRLASATPRSDDYVLLPDSLAREPLAPVVRDDDAAWADIVRWVVFATIAAEERGISSANVDEMKHSKAPDIRRFLGATANGGDRVGLDGEWAYRIVRQVGNYSEIFDRHLGSRSPFKLERGLNALAGQGGLMYAPPF
jgi:general L-amino acid transport system substrate-binding protein